MTLSVSPNLSIRSVVVRSKTYSILWRGNWAYIESMIQKKRTSPGYNVGDHRVPNADRARNLSKPALTS